MRRVLPLPVIWTWLPALVGLIWLLSGWIMPGFAIQRVISLWVQRDFLPHGLDVFQATGWFWIWTAFSLALSAIVAGSYASEREDGLSLGITWALVVAVPLVLVWPFTMAVWDNDKVQGRFYNAATVFHVPTLSDPPGSVATLVNGSRPGRNGCVRVGAHDVPSCIKVDNAYPAMRWESRTSSLASARTAMTQAASTVQGVDVMSTSLTYIWGSGANTGQWSAILDGSGDSRPAYGVAEWDGQANTTTVCRFDGDHRFNRAFRGDGANDLHHLLAERYPKLVFADTDVWGYCTGGQPVIVVVVQKQVAHADRTLQTAAGVLVLHGSPSGDPDIAYRPTLKPGELPGPVYPISLVRVQRDATSWAAGRGNRNSSFGFRVSDFGTQSANPGEYLLRGADHRLYYVTPLAPRGTRSQAFIGYGIVRADQVSGGHLNTYDLYTLANGDPLIADLNALYAKSVPLTGGADLEQFIPLGADRWRVYGVRNGQTVLYIDLSVTDQIQPTAVALTGPEASSPTQGPSPATDCGQPPDKLTNQQLARCLADFGDELRRRNGG